MPLDRPVTHITRPAKGAVDRTSTGSEPREDETGVIGSNGRRCKPLNEGNEGENSPEHPLLLTTSSLPPPITATKMVKFLITRQQN